MLTLTDDLITEIEINGHNLKLNMAFDNIVKINQIQNNDELTDLEQMMHGAHLLFSDNKQINHMNHETLCRCFVDAYTKLFIDTQKKVVTYDRLGNPMPEISSSDDGEEEQSYCLTQDAEYIFSSFMMDYNINLLNERGKMHWYEFQVLLNGLSDDTMFNKVMRIRREPLPKDAKDRSAAEKLKKQFALKPKHAKR